MSTIKRCISLLLAALMILGIVPSSAFAISTESHPQENTVLVEKTTHESMLLEPMGATADGLDYVVHSDQVTIYGYRGTATDVVIPSQIEGLPVTSIHSGTFRSCTSLTSIYIPDSVTHIGEFAFYCCYNLTNIYIPDSITEIGEYTFYRCHGLNSITIPDSVTHIGDNAFAFSGNLVSVYIPDSVTHIGDRAFCGCDSLTSVFIPDSVIYIGEAAFSGFSLTGIHVDDDNPSYSSDDQGVLFDKGKTRLIQAPDAIQDFYTIPDSVSDIGIFAFCGTNLTSITIPDSVTYIGYAAFSDCYRLASIRFKGNAPEFDDGGDIFYGVTATASYPARNPTWASYVMQDYGGSITWEPYYLDGEIAASVYDYFDDTMIRISPLELDSLWSLFAPLTGVTLSSWNEEVILTEGEYFIRRADASIQDVVLSKDGYRDYILPTEVAKTMREKDGIAYALTAYMQKDTKDGKPYISTVFGRESGSDNTYADLRVTDLSVKEDSGSDIIVTAAGFDNQKVTYYLAQDSIHKISSSNGLFLNEWLYDIFDDTSTVYAYAVGSDGTQTDPLAIRINREEPFELAKELLDDSEWSFFGKDCFRITLSDDIPLLGGTELDISAFTFPVGISLEGDEMKISLGTDWFSSTEDADGYKWKAFKDLVIKQEEVNTETIDAFFKDYKKTTERTGKR